MEDERYSWWQNALAVAFFAPQDGPVVLFIDDSELRKIAPELQDPAADLAHAVRAVSSHRPGEYFSRVTDELRLWKDGDRASSPPVLPVLAITVLAATRMRSDGQALSTNYYLRLAESIEPLASEQGVAELKTEVAGSAFLDVVDMWCTLDDWIGAQDGRVGVSTIRNHERLTRIGYPQSQALLTRADRAGLTRFFAALRIREAELPDEHSMLRALQVWTTASQNRLGETFMAALHNAETKGLIAAIVLACGAAWDGLVITKDGRRRIAIRLGLDLEEWTTSWLFPIQDGAPDAITLDGLAVSDPSVRLTENQPSRYYVVENMPGVGMDLISRGFRLRGSEYVAEFLKTEVLIFGREADTGAWASTAGITPYETHVIAATGAESAAVARVLSSAADKGWVSRKQGAKPVLPGFVLYEGVRFTNDTALQDALSQEPGLRALGVAPTLIPRARLVRGLPLDREFAPNHYLLGGEPDLLLPTEEEPKLAVLSLGGIEEIVAANGFPFELRRFPSPEGTTEIVADGQKLSFTLLEESVVDAAPKGTATLGWDDDGTLAEDTGSFRVIGAVVSRTPDAAFVMCRRGRDETWLLLDGGRAQRIAEPSPPTFITTTAGFSFLPAYFEVPASTSARWLAQRSGANWHLSRLGPGVQQELNASFDVIGTWERTAEPSRRSYWEIQLGLANG